jgi:uncharacterized protein (TIGR02677 family)
VLGSAASTSAGLPEHDEQPRSYPTPKVAVVGETFSPEVPGPGNGDRRDAKRAPGVATTDGASRNGHEPAAQAGLTQVHVVAYATTPNAHIYRPIMRLFYENRQQYGQHLPPSSVAERLRRLGIDRALDDVVLDLDQLVRWRALEAQHDSSRARTASELVRRHFVYDITAAGELTERYLEQLDGLVEQAGSLQGTRLPAILQELTRLAEELRNREPEAQVLQSALTNLVAALDELHSGANDFTRELAKVMHATEALDEDAFHAYKSRVLEYLEGFRADLERFTNPIADAIAAVEEQGVDRMVTLIASIEQAPAYNVSEEEARRRVATARRNQWTGVRNWFVGSRSQPPPFQRLDSGLLDAIGWILRAVQRLKERRSQRVDRSVEYRHLARVFAQSTDAECHALYAAAFGLYAPRHFGAPEDDPGLTGAQCSFWEASVPHIEAHLRNPGRRAPGQGRGARMVDNSMAQEALRLRRARERQELARAVRRFAGKGAVRLSDIKRLDETEFSHLLNWLGRALEAGRDDSGRLQAESSDGSASITLATPSSPEPSVVLDTPRGRFHTPDYELEIRGAV